MVRHVRVTKWVSSFYHFLGKLSEVLCWCWRCLILRGENPENTKNIVSLQTVYPFFAISAISHRFHFRQQSFYNASPHIMIFSYFLWSYVLCLTGWRWALTRGIERVFPHLSVSNMILCLAAVYITLVTCWCILSGFLCRLMQRNVPKQRFCKWDKYLEPDQVNSANLLSIFWPLFVLLDSFEKNK